MLLIKNTLVNVVNILSKFDSSKILTNFMFKPITFMATV